MLFEPELEPDTGVDDGYAELEDGVVLPMAELGLVEDWSVEGVEEDAIQLEEEFGAMLELAVGEFDAIEEVGVGVVDEDGLRDSGEDGDSDPCPDMEPMFWGISRRPRLPLPLALLRVPAFRFGRSWAMAEPLRRARRVVARRCLRCMVCFSQCLLSVVLFGVIRESAASWLFVWLYTRFRDRDGSWDPLRGQGYMRNLIFV